MPNFSKNPQQLLDANFKEYGYVGLHMEQGVPVLDRDLNLMADLLGESLRTTIGAHIGDGAPNDSNNPVQSHFRIQECSEPTNDFQIMGGKFLVHGIEISTTTILYSTHIAQNPGVIPPLLPLTVPGALRHDQVYLDVWLEEVGASVDPALYHPDEYEMETAVRLKPRWVVRVAEGTSIPVAPSGHFYSPLAVIDRPAGVLAIKNSPPPDEFPQGMKILDLRVTDLSLPSQAQQFLAGSATRDYLHTHTMPIFAPKPFSAASGYPGMCLAITGRNFDIGTITVEVGYSPVLPPSYATPSTPPPPKSKSVPGQTWVETEMIGDAQCHRLQVRIPNGVYGDVVFRIGTLMGQVKSPSFRVCGPPVFAPTSQQISAPEVPYTKKRIVLNGLYFGAADNVKIEHALIGVDLWYATTIQESTPLGCAVLTPNFAGTFRCRVKNNASSDWVVSDDTLKIYGP